MRLGSGYRVHVSRMMLVPFGAAVVLVMDGKISPTSYDAFSFLLLRNSRRSSSSVHWNLYGANLSLLPPRHRCHEPLSAALSALVRESRANSYLVRQDGLW